MKLAVLVFLGALAARAGEPPPGTRARDGGLTSAFVIDRGRTYCAQLRLEVGQTFRHD